MAKRNKELEAEVMEWIFKCLGESVPNGAIEDVLKDGVVLCNLMNKLTPGCIKKIQAKGTNFQLMENIQRFQDGMKKYGVPQEEIFQTADLFERRNIPQVVLSLYALGRMTQKHPEWQGPTLGPKMAEKNERTFTEEQLRAHEADYVKTCNINEPNFINCSTHAVQLLFNELPRGVPEIGLEPLDPLRVKRIKILQGAGPVNVNASLSNVTVVGFAHTKIVENRVDPVTYDFHTDLRLPRLRIDGRYVLLGRILVIPLRGIGQCWFDARNLEISAKSKVKMIKRGEFHFFSVQGITVKFQIGGLRLHLGNLFDGIKALEETTNAYLNENWRLVADSLNPILAKTIEDIMLDILKKVFDNVPADFFVNGIKEELVKEFLPA